MDSLIQELIPEMILILLQLKLFQIASLIFFNLILIFGTLRETCLWCMAQIKI